MGLLLEGVRFTEATAFPGSGCPLGSTWRQGYGRLQAAPSWGPERAWQGTFLTALTQLP